MMGCGSQAAGRPGRRRSMTRAYSAQFFISGPDAAVSSDLAEDQEVNVSTAAASRAGAIAERITIIAVEAILIFIR